MDSLEYWHLANSYTLSQAALLFCGEDPSDFRSATEGVIERNVSKYYAVLSALEHAVIDGEIKAQVSYVEGDFGEPSSLNVYRTRISRAVLDDFFDRRGVAGEFFGKVNRPSGGASSQLPLKLNAAIRAWTAVTSDPSLLRGKSPKQALRAWLVAHADELGLTNRAGEPNATGIDEICKVANWKPEGGATPTPGPLPTSSKSERQRPDEFDEDVPF